MNLLNTMSEFLILFILPNKKLIAINKSTKKVAFLNHEFLFHQNKLYFYSNKSECEPVLKAVNISSFLSIL